MFFGWNNPTRLNLYFSVKSQCINVVHLTEYYLGFKSKGNKFIWDWGSCQLCLLSALMKKDGDSVHCLNVSNLWDLSSW